MSITVQLTVTYDANGGSNPPPDQSTFGFGDDFPINVSIPVRPIDSMRRDGYTCIGWSTNSSATSASYRPGDYYTYQFNGGLRHTSRLYAVWQRNRAYVYFDANGGSGGPSTFWHWQGSSVTLPTDQPTRDGYTFVGWATSASATTAQYQPGGTYYLPETVTLYAVWGQDVNAYVKVNGAWKRCSNIYVKVGGVWKSVINAFTKVGGTWKPS